MNERAERVMGWVDMRRGESAQGDAMQRESEEAGMGQERDEVIEIHLRAGET